MGVSRWILVAVTVLKTLDVAAMTIDGAISAAADSSGLFDYVDDCHDMVQLEMDMMIPMKQWDVIQKLNTSDGRTKRKAIKDLRTRWTDKTIPYFITDEFSTDDVEEINKAIHEWETYTCVKFKELKPSEHHSSKNKVRFQNGLGCSSNVGMLPVAYMNPQTINLGRGCRKKGVIVHEIGHAVGFFHEQSRPDRDQYVKILYENISPTKHSQFQLWTDRVINTYGVPYDYTSVMHYGGDFFTFNRKRTIETLDPNYQTRIGNRVGLSFNDVKLANLMYRCSDRCTKKICGEGFVGKDCKCWCRSSDDSPARHCGGGKIDGSRTGDGGSGGYGPDPTSSPDPGECSNMHARCVSYAQNGECKSNAGYMLMYCKKACGHCNQDEQCEDMSLGCSYLRRAGFCSRFLVTYMRNNCKKSCGLCSEFRSGIDAAKEPSNLRSHCRDRKLVSGATTLLSFLAIGIAPLVCILT